MRSPKSTGWFLAVVVVVAVAGSYIPALYDSTGLDQSSEVQWHVVLRAVSASLLVFFAVTIGWLAWRRAVRKRERSDDRRGGQFGLRAVFAVTTIAAMGASAWTAFQEQTEIRLVGLYVFIVLVGMLVGRATFAVSPDSSSGGQVGVAHMASVTGQRRRIMLAGLVLISIHLGICWWLEFRHGFAAIVWLAIFAGLLRYSEHSVRLGAGCFLVAIFLPYAWLVRNSQWLGDPTDLLSFLPAVPGIVPAAMIKWTPDSLLLPTGFLVFESLVGYWVACRGRMAIAWLTGFACSANLFASFGLHALFRA